MMPWQNDVQNKNIAWYLPRPRRDRYKGGMPLHCEEWLLLLAKEIIGKSVSNDEVLQPFAGLCQYGVKLDIRRDVQPDIVGDAHNLPFKDESFWIVLCDPPYSNEEARKLYGTPPLQFYRWTKECIRVLKAGGVLILYHKLILPNPDSSQLKLVKRVFIGHRVWHAPRVALFFVKKPNLYRRLGLGDRNE